MPTIRDLLPYRDLDDSLMAKTQCPVALIDKRTVVSAIGDDGALTFVIQYAFIHAAKFIRANNIRSYDPASHERFIEYIRNGADPRAVGPSVTHDVTGGTSAVQRPDAPTKGKSKRAR